MKLKLILRKDCVNAPFLSKVLALCHLERAAEVGTKDLPFFSFENELQNSTVPLPGIELAKKHIYEFLQTRESTNELETMFFIAYPAISCLLEAVKNNYNMGIIRLFPNAFYEANWDSYILSKEFRTWIERMINNEELPEQTLKQYKKIDRDINP